MGHEALVVGEGDDGRGHPGEARASARATAVRLRKASAVIPEETSAKPDVGSEAGQPITKLAALNGVCWPMRISPALWIPSTTPSMTSSATATWRCSGA